ncbi:MAG: PCRF domain-containing protein, partial [Phascolarctobacterium sp.]|nr:PCRF domain-containing protein [Phascolarctobacterium sp.]
MSMLDKLHAVEDRFLDLEMKISDPDVIANQTEWLKCTRQHAKMEPIVTAYREYRDMIKAKEEAEEILGMGGDDELVEMAKEELKDLKP